MIKEFIETKQVTTTKKIKVCDDCGKQINHSMACSVAICELCGADLCDKCVVHENNTMGEYCKSCYAIYQE